MIFLLDILLLFSFFATYLPLSIFFFFFFNDTATTEIYTLSLHDALPIFIDITNPEQPKLERLYTAEGALNEDRKSTRLNSSHANISYAVFCLKKKKNKKQNITTQQNQKT